MTKIAAGSRGRAGARRYGFLARHDQPRIAGHAAIGDARSSRTVITSISVSSICYTRCCTTRPPAISCAVAAPIWTCCAGKLRRVSRRRVERLPAVAFSRATRSVVQRVFQRAAAHVQSAGHQEINGGNVLVAMFTGDRVARAVPAAGGRASRVSTYQLHLARRLQGRRRQRSRV